MPGVILIIIGLFGVFWGGQAALSGKRPLDLMGALVAAAGVLVAGLGAVRWFVPGFFG